MAKIEVEYFEPEPGPGKTQGVPLGLRLTALRAIIQESLLHPNVKSYIRVDVENNRVIVQREKKKPKENR